MSDHTAPASSGRYYQRFYQVYTDEIRGLNRPAPIEWVDRSEEEAASGRYFHRFYNVTGEEMRRAGADKISWF